MKSRLVEQFVNSLLERSSDTAEQEAINAHFDMPEDVNFYANAANFDLYYGPRESFEDDPVPWQGFQHATKIVRDWVENNVHDVYVDTDSDEVSDREPEPWQDEETGDTFEPDLSTWRHYDERAVKRMLFGRELASYV